MAVEEKPSTLEEQLGGSFVGTRNDLEISRHVFFSETSYVVRDPVTFDGHNLSPADYEVFTTLTDDKPLSEICDTLIKRGVFPEVERESFYHYVVELQKRNLLNLPVTDSDLLYRQYEQKQSSKSKGILMKLLFIKLPLGSPDRFLSSTYHLAKGFFTKTFFLTWLVGLAASFLLIAAHWQEFSSDLSSAMAIQNLPAMLIVMSILKFWHELGHGYACRHFGVSVPNSGLLFMLGTPLAFMDASGSWSLPSRFQRQIINLAGIYFELMLSIVAAFVWVFVNNSFVCSIAHFALVISSVTTIAFNINPLMKYDGYFVLADSLGIPNLKSRASFTVQNLSKQLFFKIPMPSSSSRSLRAVLITYGIAASLYKVSLTIGIAILISLQIWVIGLVVGAYYVLASLGGMLRGIVKYLIWSEEIADQRRLAWCYLGLIVVFIPCAVLSCPIPGRAQAQGVVEPTTTTILHSEHGGFVRQILANPGDRVGVGEVACQLENLELESERNVKEAELGGLLVKYRKEKRNDRVDAAKTSKEISQTRYELASLTSVEAIADVSAPIDGMILEQENELVIGQYVEPGGELLRIGDDKGWRVTAVANSESLADIRPQVGQVVHCRMVSDSGKTCQGKIRTISVSGSQKVPFHALTHLAGGFIPVSGESLEATEPFFELSIELLDTSEYVGLKDGMVCEIRFRNHHNTMANYFYRALLRFTNQINLSN